jgi:hypothetical protein
MKVKIGNKIYDSDKTPIMLIFDTDKERKETAKHLSEMGDIDSIRKYCQYPDGEDIEKIRKFMREI